MTFGCEYYLHLPLKQNNDFFQSWNQEEYNYRLSDEKHRHHEVCLIACHFKVLKDFDIEKYNLKMVKK